MNKLFTVIPNVTSRKEVRLTRDTHKKSETREVATSAESGDGRIQEKLVNSDASIRPRVSGPLGFFKQVARERSKSQRKQKHISQRTEITLNAISTTLKRIGKKVFQQNSKHLKEKRESGNLLFQMRVSASGTIKKSTEKR